MLVTTGVDKDKIYRYQNSKWEHIETADSSIIADVSARLIKTGSTPPLGDAFFGWIQVLNNQLLNWR